MRGMSTWCGGALVLRQGHPEPLTQCDLQPPPGLNSGFLKAGKFLELIGMWGAFLPSVPEGCKALTPGVWVQGAGASGS